LPKDIGILLNHFLSSLLFLNLVVELGQLTIIISAYYLISYRFPKKKIGKEKEEFILHHP
jgi:hypothetical protein